MKSLKFALLVFFALLPLQWLMDWQVTQMKMDRRQQARLETAADKALRDGVLMLEYYVKTRYDDKNQLNIQVDPGPVMTSMVQSFSLASRQEEALYGVGIVGYHALYWYDKASDQTRVYYYQGTLADPEVQKNLPDQIQALVGKAFYMPEADASLYGKAMDDMGVFLLVSDDKWLVKSKMSHVLSKKNY